MDWQLIIQVLGVIGGLVVSAFQLRGRLPKSRSTLKHDLEILGLMDSTDPKYPVIKKAIDTRILDIYQASNKQDSNTGIQWGGVTTSIIVLFIFALWTAFALKDGFSWIAIPTALVTMLAFFATIGFISPDDSPESESLNSE